MMGTFNCKKLGNKELIDSLLNQITLELGYHIKDKWYNNSEYDEEEDKYTICEFRIEEIPNFLFGIWKTQYIDDGTEFERDKLNWFDSWNISSLSELVIFAQYERYMDKFKPSRSSFRLGLFRQTYEQNDDNDNLITITEWNMWELGQMLKYMKEHRFRASEYSARDTRYIWEEEPNYLKFYCTSIRDIIKDEIYKKKKILYDKYLLFKLKRALTKTKTMQYIMYRQENCYPYIVVRLRRFDSVYDNKKLYKRYLKEYNRLDKFDMTVKSSILDIGTYDEQPTEDNKEYFEQVDNQLKQEFNELIEHILTAKYFEDGDKVLASNIPIIIERKMNKCRRKQ